MWKSLNKNIPGKWRYLDCHRYINCLSINSPKESFKNDECSMANQVYLGIQDLCKVQHLLQRKNLKWRSAVHLLVFQLKKKGHRENTNIPWNVSWSMAQTPVIICSGFLFPTFQQPCCTVVTKTGHNFSGAVWSVLYQNRTTTRLQLRLHCLFLEVQHTVVLNSVWDPCRSFS